MAVRGCRFVARAGFLVSVPAVLVSLYSWLSFGDVPNLTFGGMAAQTVIAVAAFAVGAGALLGAERGRDGTAFRGCSRWGSP